MKRILTAFAVLALSLPTVVIARDRGPDPEQTAQRSGANHDDEDRGGQQGRGGHGRAGREAGGAPNANAPASGNNVPNANAPGGNQGRGDFGRSDLNAGDAGPPRGSQGGRDQEFGRGRNPNAGQTRNNERTFDSREGNFDRRADGAGRARDFNRNFGYERDRAFGRKFSFRGRSYVAVRAPAFRYPRGWSYRRWFVGGSLPLFFLSEPYYIDYDWVGLPPPPPGYEWVRYGPDALLVNIYTGRIADIVNDVFY